jgi:hypothetical protein
MLKLRHRGESAIVVPERFDGDLDFEMDKSDCKYVYCVISCYGLAHE